MKIVTFGELMLRFSTDNGIRLADAQSLATNYGGGEANVAISLAHFGHQAKFISQLPNNSLGVGALAHLRRNQVDTSAIIMTGNRIGTYYLETGVSNRSSQVIYDRAGSSFAEIRKNVWDNTDIFENVDIFHLSGISLALSSTLEKVAVALIRQAKASGCKISFDINYRSKLWSQERAAEVIQRILPFVDYCSAGQLDARFLLHVLDEAETVPLEICYQRIYQNYPNIEYLFSTQRESHSASQNSLQGFIFHQGNLTSAKKYLMDPIIDRIGGGDAFVAGILHGILSKWPDQMSIEFATAASVLKHSIKGDCNSFSELEVLEFMTQSSDDVAR